MTNNPNATRIEQAKILLRQCSIEEAAKQAGFASRTHFDKVFKNHTGQTAKNYQESQIVRAAKPLLLEHSVRETFEALGIAENTFLEIFKRQTGLTPTEYQKEEAPLRPAQAKQQEKVEIAKKLLLTKSTRETSAELGLSARQFNEIFKLETGLTPTEHREQQRLKTAKELLRTKSVKETREAIGLSEAAFHKMFSRLTGTSPGQYQTQVTGRITQAFRRQLTPQQREIQGAKIQASNFKTPIKEISETREMKPKTFQARFSKAAGLSLTEYRTQKRISKAKNLLLDLTISIEEIAKTLNLTQPGFWHLFSRLEGCTPTDWRIQNNTKCRPNILPYALELLADTKKHTHQIADFFNLEPDMFETIFQRATGLLPRQWRLKNVEGYKQQLLTKAQALLVAGKLSTEQIYEDLDITKKQFFALFAELENTTPAQWLKEHQFEKAQELLLRRYACVDVAAQVKCSPELLNTIFRDRTGQTAYQWQETHSCPILLPALAIPA